MMCLFITKVVWIILLALSHSLYAFLFEPCETQRILPDMDQRGINSTLGQSGHIIDDHYNIPATGDWFKVQSQHMLNNVSLIQELKTCGTVFPIYLNGSLPNAQDGIVERIACTVGFGSVCRQPMNIRIKMCGHYSVYFLQRPASTSSAYCFLYPSKSLPPKLGIPKPVVNISLVDMLSPVFNINVQSLQFICDFTLLNEDVQYEVIWYIDGQAINETKTANKTDMDQLVLEEGHGQLERLGVNVACAVRARLTSDEMPGQLSPISDPFYAGIESTPSVTLHRETPKAHIVVKPTVPIGCPTLFQDGCEVVVELIIPETYKCRGSVGAVLPVGAQTCGTHIRHDEWDQEHKIYIAWLDDQTYSGHPDSYRISLRTAINNYNPIWSEVVLNDVTVLMEDNTKVWKGKECHAICDPHMKTFDGRNYENQNDGTFILYENDDPSRKVKVQMKVTPCNPPAHVYCVCAIAVRAGGDVFVIDRCPGIYRPVFQFRSCEDYLLDVRKINDNVYKIYLPSGTYLNVHLWHYTGKDVMDLHMYPSAADVFHTRGLCGTLNGRTDDDFSTPDGQITGDNNIFATSWRVTNQDENLITMSAGALENLTIWNRTENTQFCTCNGPSRNISCTHDAIATCVRDDESPVVKQNRCRNRRSRSLLPIDLVPTSTAPLASAMPLQQQWNVTTATNYCEKFLKGSTSFNTCANKVPATDPANSIDSCVLDIMATQTTVWATSARESLKSVCLKELKQNTTYQEEDSADQPSIAQQIKAITCPNECSGHGHCDNGTCVCTRFYGASDCSVDIRVPPQIHGVNVDTSGTCDVNECHLAIVEGDTFVDIETLTCHNTLYKIYINGTEESYMQMSTPGHFNTLMEVFCPLPLVSRLMCSNVFAYRWSLGVSNDGHHDGNISDIIIYNGLCQSVNQSTSPSVTMLEHFCFIGGLCVAEGSVNPLDSCSICNTNDSKSRYEWSRNPDYCLLDGMCMANGELKRDDNCSRCDVSISIDKWSLNLENIECRDRHIETTTVTDLPPTYNIHKPVVNVSIVDKLSPLFNINMQSLQFVCDFTLLDEDLVYEVVWYIDGEAINETKRANKTGTDRLVLEEGPGQLERLGVNVACSVRARLQPDGAFGLMSPTSEPFYAGILSTPSVTLYRDKPTTYIVLKPTVPIGCPKFFQDGCEVVVELILPETYKCRGSVGAVLPVGAQTCGTHIRHDEWDQEHKIYIAWLDDQTYSGHQDSYRVSLRTAVNNYNPIWSEVVLNDVTVIMDDNTQLWKGKECHAVSDPHMKTFDGRSFENQNAGTFILYENDDASRKVQVQMKVTPCNPPAHAFCVCGIAVRAGGDVFVIDRCPGKYRPVFEFRSCEDHLLDVRKINEHMYKIYLPSGTYLSAYLWHYTGKDVMDLHMYPSATDTFHTRGLCGTLNGRTDDDFTQPDGQITGDNNIFSQSWSVNDQDENLITMSADALQKLTIWNRTENIQFCTCNGPSHNISCTHDAIATCVRDDESPVVKQNRCRNRRSRSLRPISVITNTTEQPIVTMPLQIWNTTTATDYCEKFLRGSTSFETCAKQVPATDPSNSVDTCVLDIMVTQTTMWATSARESLKSVCLKELKQNTTYHEADSADQPSIAQQIKEITCPNECSGHGHCENGTCTCDTYFGAADCSIDIRIPPHIYGINLDTNSTCDLNTCQVAIVEGEKFIDTKNLTCHNTLYEINPDGKETLLNLLTTNAQFNTFVEVFCPIPTKVKRSDKHHFAYKWSVGVSNDGQNFGQASDLIVYHGVCQNVMRNNTATVEMKDKFCFVDGFCVPEGVTHRSDPCRICNTTGVDATFKWSQNQGHCLIDGVCLADGEVKSGDNCTICDVSISLDHWTQLSGTGDCNDKSLNASSIGLMNEMNETYISLTQKVDNLTRKATTSDSKCHKLFPQCT